MCANRARITETMLAGTLLTVTGTIMIVNFASMETLELSISEIKNLDRSTAYVVYLVLMVIALVVLHVVYIRLATMSSVNSFFLFWTRSASPIDATSIASE